MPLDVLHQVAEAFAFVVPCALIMHITERPLNGVGPWTVGRQPEQLKTGVAYQPLLHRFGFMDTVVIHHDRDTRDLGSWVRAVQ